MGKGKYILQVPHSTHFVAYLKNCTHFVWKMTILDPLFHVLCPHISIQFLNFKSPFSHANVYTLATALFAGAPPPRGMTRVSSFENGRNEKIIFHIYIIFHSVVGESELDPWNIPQICHCLFDRYKLTWQAKLFHSPDKVTLGNPKQIYKQHTQLLKHNVWIIHEEVWNHFSWQTILWVNSIGHCLVNPYKWAL